MNVRVTLKSLRAVRELRRHDRWTRAQLEIYQARVEDSLTLPSLAGDRVAVQPLVFNRIMDILPVSGWQIVQEADDGLTVLLSGAGSLLVDTTLEDQLAKGLAAHGAHVPRITIHRVSFIPKTPSGKAPLIKAHQPARQ